MPTISPSLGTGREPKKWPGTAPAGVTWAQICLKSLASWPFLGQMEPGLEGWSSWGMTHHVARVYTVTHADNHVRPFLSRLNLSRQVGFLGVTADTTLHPSHELGVEWETLLMSGGPYYVEGCTPNSWRPSHALV